jgi:hypothetical protein
VNYESFARLQDWYARHCDGSWEHQHGVQIETIDNPGWRVYVDLAGTPLSECPMEELRRDVADDNWLVCRVQNLRFEGFGGPRNLVEIVDVFVAWVEAVER